MEINYTVTAIPKKRGKKGKHFYDVYDIGHYYARNCGEINHEVIRLLSRRENLPPYRDYINLFEYDVLIQLTQEGENNDRRGPDQVDKREPGGGPAGNDPPAG